MYEIYTFADIILYLFVLGHLAAVHWSSWGCLQEHQDHRRVPGWWADQRC